MSFRESDRKLSERSGIMCWRPVSQMAFASVQQIMLCATAVFTLKNSKPSKIMISTID